MSIDLSQFYEVFFEESFEGLDVMESELMALSPGYNDPETLNTIFRAAHSIKGGSGTFGFDDVANFTHDLETLLDQIREGTRSVTTEYINLFLKAVDCLRDMLQALRAKRPIDTQVTQQITDAFLAILNEENHQSTTDQHPAEPATTSVDEYQATNQELEQGFGFFDDIPDLNSPDLIPPTTWHITFNPKPHLFRTGNEPTYIFLELGELGEINVVADVCDLPIYNQLTPDDSYFRWQITLTTTSEKQAIEEIFEWVIDDAEVIITAAQELETEALNPTEQQNQIASTPQATEQSHQPSETTETTNIKETSEASDTKLINEPNSQNSEAPNLKLNNDIPPPKEVKKATEATSIRVSIEKIDSLINMVGELVITQAMLNQYAEGELTENRRMSMLEGLAQLAHNTRQLQESVMQIRMLPISFVFSRFPRLVRDISQKLDKEVDLKFTGERTELDKTVMEKISDPMVHLIRNSLDHGLETPQERIAAGKTPTGTVCLNAFHQSGNIVIEITDDGRGIDPQKIRHKAIAKGLIHANDELTDQELIELVFLPGFSTKTQVSDLSGRGVGMDVVRRNIQELNGSVEVSSQINQGSTFTIRLPLTLAILDGQLVTVGGNTYIIPLVNIIESIQTAPQQLNNAGGDLEIFRRRDEYIPIVRLYQVFNHQNAVESLTEGILVIVESDHGHVGLLVDHLLGQQQVVIKSLEANYQRVEGISGATILGDGTISLIIDIQGVINLAGLKKHQRKKTQTNNTHDMAIG